MAFESPSNKTAEKLAIEPSAVSATIGMPMKKFELVSDYTPQGDQPEAIRDLVDNLEQGLPDQVLLGVTGSGKTFTMANVVATVNRPTLVIAHNKTLAAQLYTEFKELFPNNAVEYFVSYYDYYQPEAYLPASDTFIEKDLSINEEVDKMRHSATRSLLERDDVLIVASVSCIYGLGSPEAYYNMLVRAEVGQELDRDAMLTKLIEIQYQRNDIDFHRGTFRVRGDVVEIFPSYEENRAVRLEFFGDIVESISAIDPLRGTVIEPMNKAAILPSSHYVTQKPDLERATKTIKEELKVRLEELYAENKLVEAQRLDQRTMYDLEMIQEMGYCTGIENYSSHLDGREPGSPPACLLDYFPDNFLVVIDESHATVPQVRGMYNGDRSRKQTLVSFGFRLPSALDNRPLNFEEFLERVGQKVFVSATPGDWEMERSQGLIIEQIIRPTGLMDPEIQIKPATGQVDDLLEEIRTRIEMEDKVLVTTLTKRMAEDLTDYYKELGIRVKYLHSDVATLDRYEIIRDLRRGLFDVLVGVNLLREGLDIPEVSLVAILDADKEGFLRGERALIQTCGRAARNVRGTVILYADKMTRSMDVAIKETNRRRTVQEQFNKDHNITPTSIQKDILEIRSSTYESDYVTIPIEDKFEEFGSLDAIEKEITNLKAKMIKAAEDLEFETAAELRDKIKELREVQMAVS